MNVLLVDDHPILREAVAELIRHEFSAIELRQAASLGEAAAAAGRPASTPVDLVLLDLGLPDAEGLEALRRIRDWYPDATIVVLSAESLPEVILAAVEHGAAGFIPKTSSSREMVAALRRALAGEVYLPPAALVSPHGRDEAQMRELLTPRQLDVLALLAQGQPNKRISRQLGLAESTVKTHLDAIFRKLDVTTRTQAVVAAARLGLRMPPA